jgi:iron complex transport system substrate-binding protein
MSGKKIFLIVIAVLLAACSPAVSSTPTVGGMETSTSTTEASTPITLVDDLGRTLVLAAPAQRVVSLSPANTEILFAVGAGGQVVGRDETSEFPADALALPTIGGYSGFNLEAIVALHPDLVLAQGGGFNSPELVASLEGLGLTVFSLPNPTTLEGMFTNLETVAALTDRKSTRLNSSHRV